MLYPREFTFLSWRELFSALPTNYVLALLAASEVPGKWKDHAIMRAKSRAQNLRDLFYNHILYTGKALAIVSSVTRTVLAAL